ncbi:IS4 family transposase [Pandoraea sp. SD6-2]|uniref:IS4 family transposase n=1 Tax=Pandoraea sp. SD6-2 TaxID=1286093 RepID=UPI00039FAF08|nr:IS4 family transposase [Pandoraea sp. SD6-2]
MLGEHLTCLVGISEPADYSRLAEHLPYEWIHQALSTTGTASLRRRRLPADRVLWLVIALAIYRSTSIDEVVHDLGLVLSPSDSACLSKSAVTQARQRCGQAPMQSLFQISACAWIGQQSRHYSLKGLSLWAIDGTTLRAADSPENREHFGAQIYKNDRVASSPQVRAVSLTSLPSHLVGAVRFGPYGTNEMLYAKSLISDVPNHSITVFDKGFLSAEILCALRANGEQRHFVIPARCNTQWERVSGSPRDQIVRMRVSPQARKKCPELGETWQARCITGVDAHGRERVLLTSLSERTQWRASDIEKLYQRRWEIETSYRELKQVMLGSALTLRSRTVDGIYQEIWGALIGYNLIRVEMAAAARTGKIAPTDISFIRALHAMQHELWWAARTRALAKLPAWLASMHQRLLECTIQKRPGRRCPRAVKARPSKYTVRFLKKSLN